MINNFVQKEHSPHIKKTFTANKRKMSETTDNSTQWPLNQAAYQNLANDQVDWAALAQQWIHMKETCTTDQLLAAPPPPIISKQNFEEQGEAPMEVEKDDEQLNLTQFSSNSNATPDAPTWQPGWQGQGQQSQWRKSEQSINNNIFMFYLMEIINLQSLVGIRGQTQTYLHHCNNSNNLFSLYHKIRLQLQTLNLLMFVLMVTGNAFLIIQIIPTA